MIRIIKANFNNPLHCEAEIQLMRCYMGDKMGANNLHTIEEEEKLIIGLKGQPNVLVFFALWNNNIVGLTNSFINFSTFSTQPFINIHDVIVFPHYRRLGIGKRLIEENIRYGKEVLRCSKITLEVRADNDAAKKLYQSLGFDFTTPEMLFWTKLL